MTWNNDTRCPYCGHIHEQDYVKSPKRKQIRCLDCRKDFYRSARGSLTFAEMMKPATDTGIILIILIAFVVLNSIFSR
ncbi:hypothetical protein [Alcanivorax sediminis]|uniref:Transposase zinc-ribbon domain-containing protein n=1 Tax=Alcanivorax sediminis TaxID=2663008 RepID=A0A6N7LQ56_9GAMM|nr:hypothetical protein [Alcanivorax sediminis]MQX52213.1 hypothetical protein [Alcanivorax sediminis]